MLFRSCRFSRYLALGLACWAALAAGAARAQNAAIDNLVLADVNGEAITRARLVARLLEYRGEETLEKLINRTILIQRAKELKVEATEQEAQQRLTDLQKKFKSEEDYRAWLQQNRLKENQLLEEMRYTLLIQRVATKEQPITDKDLEQYEARMIVLADRAAAEKAIKDLDGGAIFRTVATERNDEQSLRQAGGRLRPFLHIEMLDLARAIEAQKLAPGAHTKTPVALPDNRWAVIRLERRIPVSEVSASERERLTAVLTSYRVDQWLNAVREKAKVEKKGLSEGTVAVVNGEPLTRNQIIVRLLEFHGEEALEQMINRTLLLQAAKKANVAMPDAEIEKRFKEFREKFKKPEDLQSFLAQNNLSEKQLQDEIRFSTLMETVALKESPVTDEDLVQYEVRMIVAPDRETAESWVKELENGADFAQMAMERSGDNLGREVGGKMKPFLRIELLDVWRALDEQKLKPGGYTKKPVLLTTNQWVLLKLDGTIPAKNLNAMERDRLTMIVKNYRVNQWLNQTRVASRVNKPVPLSPAVIRGGAAS